jgi:hypothetical protein
VGGWFLDVFVGYLITAYRIIVRVARGRKSNGWPEATATVCGASCETQSYMPRPVAEIVYTYRFEGGFYGGVDEKPFFLDSSAKAFASRFTRGDTIVIRVKPGEPETSLVRDEDQARKLST